MENGTQQHPNRSQNPWRRSSITQEKGVYIGYYILNSLMIVCVVLTELKITKQECKKKDAEIEHLKAERLQTAGEPEKENTQQENMHKPTKELETSELNQDNPETKTTPLEKLQNIGWYYCLYNSWDYCCNWIKVCLYVTFIV